jgi:hypothetical protein
MTYDSYPVQGSGGMSIGEWTTEWGGQNGIINDLTGTSLALTRIDAGNIARIAPGQVRVGGYVLDVTANHDLTVSTTAATYHIWACYDPALNVAAGAPCVLNISSGAPSTAGNKIYQLLYTITRGASQALTAATVTDYRVWTGPTLHMPSTSAIPAGILTDPVTAITGFTFPVGSRLIYGDGSEYTLIKSTSGLKWAGGYTSWTPTFVTGPTSVGSGIRQGFYEKVGKTVHAEFRVELGSGFTYTSGTTELTLPVPAFVWGGSGIQATIGNWTARNNSVPSHYAGSLGIFSSGANSVSFNGAWDGSAPKSRVDSNDPVAWASGDVLSGVLDYRAA